MEGIYDCLEQTAGAEETPKLLHLHNAVEHPTFPWPTFYVDLFSSILAQSYLTET